MLNSHYLLVLNTLKRVTDKTKMIFRSKKKKKKSKQNINTLKIKCNKQMHQVILNACVYAKQKINSTWLNCFYTFDINKYLFVP